MPTITNLVPYKPNYAVAPGEILEEYLDAAGMHQHDLATRTGRTPKHISEIVHGKSPISPDTAIQLERVFGRPAAMWNNLQATYNLYQARERERERLPEQVAWAKLFPFRAMAKLGWLPSGLSGADLVQTLLKYFGVASAEAFGRWQAELCPNFKRSPTFGADSPALSAWLRRGEIAATALECGSYDEQAFKAELVNIRRLTREPFRQAIQKAQTACARLGVAVVIVPELPGTHVSGATRWLANRAVLQLSLRHKRDDHVWFSFFHEAAHIVLHGRRPIFLDNAFSPGATDSKEEHEADHLACETLVPRHELLDLAAKKPISRQKVVSFAESIGVAPGIVVGMLQHEGSLPFKHLNGLKQRISL